MNIASLSKGFLPLLAALSMPVAVCATLCQELAAERVHVAGKVYSISGDATARFPGEPARPLTKGAAVCEGDLLATGPSTQIQLQMADNGTLIIRPRTELKLDTFSYARNQPGKEQFLVSLITGGLRAITGLIGHDRKEDYAIKTPTATIGIRGTDHEVFHIPTEGLETARLAEAGTYNRVISGGTVLKTAGGSLLLHPNEIGFAPISGASPFLIKSLPKVFSGMPVQVRQAMLDARNRAQNADQSGTAPAAPAMPSDTTPASVATADTTASNTSSSTPSSAPPASTDTSAAGAPPASTDTAANAPATSDTAPAAAPASSGTASTTTSDSSAANAVPAAVDTSTVYTPLLVTIGNNTVDLNASSNATQAAPDGSAYVGAHVIKGSTFATQTGGLVTNGNSSTVYIDANTANPVVVGDVISGFNYESRFANIVQFGTGQVDGVAVIWGSYDGGVTLSSTDGSTQPLTAHHFAFSSAGATAPSVIANVSGSVVYDTLVGATMPSAEDGSVGGSLNAIKIGVNLGSQPGVTAYAVSATDAQNRAWAGTFNGFATLDQFAQGNLPLAATCTGTGCGSGVGNGTASGIIVGQTGSGLLTSYGLTTTTGQGIAGVAAVQNGSQLLAQPDGTAYVHAANLTVPPGTVAVGALTTAAGGASVQTDLASGGLMLVTDPVAGTQIDLRSATPASLGTTTLDGVTVQWGIYTGATIADLQSQTSQQLAYHHFALAPAGATPIGVITAMSGTVQYGNIVGATTPTTEAGELGGGLKSLSVGINLGANPGVTNYDVSVTDNASRDWSGHFNGFVSLSDFRQSGAPLAAFCAGAGCGVGTGNGKATGIVVGNTAGGMLTSYGLSTTTGQSVTGVAVLSR